MADKKTSERIKDIKEVHPLENNAPADRTDFLRQLQDEMMRTRERFLNIIRLIGLSVIVGIAVGLAATAFSTGIRVVTDLRMQHPWLLLLLPVGAVVITALYRLMKGDRELNISLVLSAIQADDTIPLRMAPLIFIATLLTHLCGGSAGRVGASLQIGGSIGNALGETARFQQADRKTMIMCGMSAAFSVMLGTPLAAAVFPLEMVSVGIMHYAAFVPCAISSLIARGIAQACALDAPRYDIAGIPPFQVMTALKFVGLAAGCALVSIAFCLLLRKTERLYSRLIKNPYLRGLAGGTLLLLMTALVGSQTYNGAGSDMIANCMVGDIHWEYFLLKMVFTACTLACGYKGGEIAPTLFIGSTFGCLFGQLAGLSPSLCAAVGMGSVFCGVTNCPITSLFLCIEMFGTKGLPYFLLSIPFSYLLSGYSGLYSGQKIVYSKYHSNFIDKRVK